MKSGGDLGRPRRGSSYDRSDWIWAAAVALSKSVCKDGNLH